MTTTVERLHQKATQRPVIERRTPAGFCVVVGEHGTIRHAGLYAPDEHTGMPILMPACGIGVSVAIPGQVRPMLLSQAVTCRRTRCRALASPDDRAEVAPDPREQQLTLGL